MRGSRWLMMVVAGFCFFVSGCSSTGNKGSIQSFAFKAVEPKWIRDGEPILYDGQKWYPQDDIEPLQDSEVTVIGNYRSVQVFVVKTDVKPYQRLYTKFDINKFRYFVSRKK